MDDPANDDDYWERVQDLRRQLRASKGHEAHLRWDSLKRSLNVFSLNAADLLQTLGFAEQNEALAIELIQNVRPTRAREDYFGLLDQRLHNALSSATSLIDHTRRVCGNYEGSAFAAEFARRNAAVRDAGGSRFLRDLRNYLIHRELVPFRHQVHFATSDSKTISEIGLDVPFLLRTPDEWSRPAKDFMEASGDFIHLSAVAREYVSSMNSLYGWVFGQFEELHGTDIDAANRLVERINLTMTRGVTDGRDFHDRMAHVAQNIKAVREGREQTDYSDFRPESDGGPT